MTKPKKTPNQRQEQTTKFIAELGKKGDLNPRHKADFDLLLDDVAPPLPKPKKK